MQIGFAGLGRMGIHMARNLARDGHDLTVWNRSPEKAQALSAELGCTVAHSPSALADATDVVITMLADDASSDAVYLGDGGVLAGHRARVFIEMGTMSPAQIARLVDRAPEGAQVIDAPVSGATQAAADAQLLIMAGCREADAADLLPLFGAMGRKTTFLGAAGAGAVMKLAVNALIHVLNQTLSEAMTLAEAAGIPPEVAFDVIENSAAAAPMLTYRRPLYLDEAAHDVTFTVALARKDMDLTVALADTLGAQMPQSRITRAKLVEAEAAGFGARDMASMLNFMRRENS